MVCLVEMLRLRITAKAQKWIIAKTKPANSSQLQGGTQSTQRMQFLDPLTILIIRFATQYILDMARIDPVNLQATRF